WMPMSEEEFWPQYQRYQRCNRVLQLYERREAHTSFWQSLGQPVERLRIRKMIRNIYRVRNQLGFLGSAVAAGQNDNENEGGTGVPAYALPDVPILSGSAAKLLPPLDPEPQWRDP